MPPKEMILNCTPLRMNKLAEYGEHVPIKIRGGGRECHAVMLNPAHMQGGTLTLAGAGYNDPTGQRARAALMGGPSMADSLRGGKMGQGTWKKIEKGSKVAAAVGAPLALAAGPAGVPVSAALGTYAAAPTISGAGKKAKKTKKTVDMAAQIAAILAASQGYDKEAAAISGVGSVIGSGKKGQKRKKAASKTADVAAILARYQGMDSEADLINALGQIAGSGMYGGALGITGNTPLPDFDEGPTHPMRRTNYAVGSGKKSPGVAAMTPPIKRPRFAVKG